MANPDENLILKKIIKKKIFIKIFPFTIKFFKQ